MNKKISKKRYDEIKIIAKSCIDYFLQQKIEEISIDSLLKKGCSILQNEEEKILFQSMVLFPDSKDFLNKNDGNKNINELARQYNVKANLITSKMISISLYETEYEETKLLHICDNLVLPKAENFNKFNKEIDQSIALANSHRRK